MIEADISLLAAARSPASAIFRISASGTSMPGTFAFM